MLLAENRHFNRCGREIPVQNLNGRSDRESRASSWPPAATRCCGGNDGQQARAQGSASTQRMMLLLVPGAKCWVTSRLKIANARPQGAVHQQQDIQRANGAGSESRPWRRLRSPLTARRTT